MQDTHGPGVGSQSDGDASRSGLGLLNSDDAAGLRFVESRYSGPMRPLTKKSLSIAHSHVVQVSPVRPASS